MEEGEGGRRSLVHFFFGHPPQNFQAHSINKMHGTLDCKNYSLIKIRALHKGYFFLLLSTAGIVLANLPKSFLELGLSACQPYI